MRYIGLALLFLGAAAQAGEVARAVNVIIIIADDLGYGDVSCYGGSTDTPNIDRLAAEGIRFTDFHSSGAVCSPTRAGLLTGRYQQRAGIPTVIFANPERNRHHGLQPGEITLPGLLKDQSYATALIGKWHLGYEPRYNPIHHGFDVFRGFVSGNVDYISHVDAEGVPDWWNGDQRVDEEGYTTHLITRHAAKFIDDFRRSPGGAGLFLLMAHEAPHYPYQVPGDEPVRKRGQRSVSNNPTRARTKYQVMVQELDRSVGQIMEAVRHDRALAESTLIIFTSDNGPVAGIGSAGGLRGAKGSVWEGGHRVPAIAWWPGTIAPGVCDDLVTSLDLMPTVMELAGVRPPPGHVMDGTSLASLLRQRRPIPPRKIVWQHGEQIAMRDGPLKLVLNAPGQSGPALFSMAEDPGEQTNLLEDPTGRARHVNTVGKMMRDIEVWKRSVAAGATVQPELSDNAPLEQD